MKRKGKERGAQRPAQEETTHSQRLLLALSYAAQAVQRARAPEEVYQTIGREVAGLGYNTSVFRLTEDRAHLVTAHLTLSPDLQQAAEKLTGLSARDFRFPLTEGGFFQRIIGGGKTVFCAPFVEPIAEALPQPVRRLAGRLAAILRLEQAIISPLTVGGEVVGLLIVSGSGLAEADTPAVTVFANQAAIALENVRLSQETRAWNAELEQRVEERTAALRESEHEFREAVTYLDEGYFSVTLDGVLLEHNQAFNRILGFDRSADLKGMHLPDFWQNPDEPREYLNSFAATGFISNYPINAKTQTGEKITVLASAHIVKDEHNRPLRIEGVFHDITERKRVEEALRRERNRLKTYLELVESMVLVLGTDSTIQLINRKGCELLGYRPEELMDKNWFDTCIPERLRREMQVRCLEIMNGKNELPFYFENPVLTRDGTERLMACRNALLSDESGRTTGTISVCEDITERKRAEEALRDSEQRYRSLFENMLDGFAYCKMLFDDQDRPVDFVYLDVNSAFERLTGLENVVGKLVTEAIPGIKESSSELFEIYSRVALTGKPERFEIDFKPLARWLSISVYSTEKGSFVAVFDNITERVRAEAELVHSNQLISALNRVAMCLQTSLVPDTIMETMGTELKRLGLICAVALLAPDGKSAVMRYISIESRSLKRVEKLLRVKMQDYRILSDHFPYFAQVIEQQRGVFVSDVLAVVIDLLDAFPKRIAEQATRLNGITHQTPGAFLPLIVEGQVKGTLAILGGGLKESDLPALSVFASQVVTAMQSARLIRSLNQHGEQLHALAARLAEMEDTERRALARELHDRLGQNLSALNVNLNIMRSQLSPDVAEKIGQRLDDTLALVEATVECTRDVMAELRPPLLDDFGLAASLRWYADQFSARSSLPVELVTDEPSPRLPPATEIALFRIAQEALNNISKHAQASQVKITLTTDLARVLLTIADDGGGFDPAPTRGDGMLAKWGLITMRERTEAMGGVFRVDSAPGSGTRVIVEVPR